MSGVPVPSGEIPVVSDVGLPVPEPENPQSTPQGETPGSDEGNLPSDQGVSGDHVQAVPAIVTWPNAPIFEQLQRETDLLYKEGWLDDPAP